MKKITFELKFNLIKLVLFLIFRCFIEKKEKKKEKTTGRKHLSKSVLKSVDDRAIKQIKWINLKYYFPFSLDRKSFLTHLESSMTLNDPYDFIRFFMNKLKNNTFTHILTMKKLSIFDLRFYFYHSRVISQIILCLLMSLRVVKSYSEIERAIHSQ